jgi:hypothetical protein
MVSRDTRSAEQVLAQPHAPHGERARPDTRSRPGGDLATRGLARSQCDDRLESGEQVAVAGEHDGHVALIARHHHHKIDGQCHVDALLLRGVLGPVGRIAQIARDQSQKPPASPDLRVGLPHVRGVGSRVAALARAPTIHSHARETTARGTAGEQMAERKRIDLTVPRGRTGRAERVAGAMVGVLVVEEEDDSLRSGVVQHRGVEISKRSPAGSE